MDKLKRFGIAIHGCIDGLVYIGHYCIIMTKLILLCRYSRKVLWLNAAKSNNNPNIIAYFYLKCVKELKGTYV